MVKFIKRKIESRKVDKMVRKIDGTLYFWFIFLKQEEMNGGRKAEITFIK